MTGNLRASAAKTDAAARAEQKLFCRDIARLPTARPFENREPLKTSVFRGIFENAML